MKAMELSTAISPLVVGDIPTLEKLEEATRLAFWGVENYRRFLEDYPEYFGRKVLAGGGGAPPALAGFLLARSLFENLEILKVGVFPELHRRGVGTLLMGSAYLEGVRRGCQRCFLEVRKSNRGAIEFYHRHGFRVAGSRLNYYTNPVEDAWIMERAL